MSKRIKQVQFRLTPIASAVLFGIAAQVAVAGPGKGPSADGVIDMRPTEFIQGGYKNQSETFYANSPSGFRAPVETAMNMGPADAVYDPRSATAKNTIFTGKPLRKFVDPLPNLCATTPVPVLADTDMAKKCIPVAAKDVLTYPGSDYYEIAVIEYQERMHSDLANPTTVRGYVQVVPEGKPLPAGAYKLTYPDGSAIKWPHYDAATKTLSYGADVYAYGAPHYLGPLIVASRGTPVRLKFINFLPPGRAEGTPGTPGFKRNGDLFIPVDQTLMGAGLGPDGATMYMQNRAELHLHGGDTPWISDGTPHQWILPAQDEVNERRVNGDAFARGAIAVNVPDMPDPGPGAVTYYWPNNQSNRLMFYHDHTAGITRLNVYAGMAAGYLITDPAEAAMVASGALPEGNIPLVIQERTFVPQDIAEQDARWSTDAWGKEGDFWFPHVYEVNQEPSSVDGTHPVGRWDWGPYFWPVFPALYDLPTGRYGDVSTTPEAFMDTPVVNGTAYPFLTVEPKAYRFRILNATNDRFLNLGLFLADSSTARCSVDNRCNTEVRMVPFNPTSKFPSTGGLMGSGWGQPDGRAGGVPYPGTQQANDQFGRQRWSNLGPNIMQIGTEGGFLPQLADIPTTITNFEYARRSVTVLNILEHGLLMGAAERADVVIDFARYANKTLIMYNDAPAPVPASDPRLDVYNDVLATNVAPFDNYLAGGAMPTQIGYGPNMRTIMQFRVLPRVSAKPKYKMVGSELDVAHLKKELPKAYAASQEKPIVPMAAYNEAFGTSWADQYAKINTGTIQQPTFDFVPAEATALGGITLIDPATNTAMNGAGYVTVPNVTVNGGGTGAMAKAVLKIGKISVTNPGSGYVNAPLVTIGTAPDANGVPAPGLGATAVSYLKLVGRQSRSTPLPVVTVLAGGSGYQVGQYLTVGAPAEWAKHGADAPGVVRARVKVDQVDGDGAITRLVIEEAGQGYTVLPTINTTTASGSGAVVELDAGVERIALTSPTPGRPDLAGGRGYTNMSLVTVTLRGGGVGGTGTAADPLTAATAVATGAVAEVTLASPGTGYTSPSITVDAPVLPRGFNMPADVTPTQAQAFVTTNSKMGVHNKAIQELFEPNYGRMNATLGIEMPFTSAMIQTTIPLAYIDPATEFFKDGETQVWKITHNGVDTHPVHFHLVNMQLINRIGWDGTIKPPKANELGWKETIQMNPLEDIVVALRAKRPVTRGVTGANNFGLPRSYRLMDPTQPQYAMTGFTQIDANTGNPAIVYNDYKDYNWEYVWHCHILGHEENDFMRAVVFDPMDAAPAQPTNFTKSVSPTVANFTWTDNANTEYQYKVSLNKVTNTTVTMQGGASVPAGVTLPQPSASRSVVWSGTSLANSGSLTVTDAASLAKMATGAAPTTTDVASVLRVRTGGSRRNPIYTDVPIVTTTSVSYVWEVVGVGGNGDGIPASLPF